MTQRLYANCRDCLPYIIITMAANFADSILTCVGLRLGYAEANPVASLFLSNTACIFAKQMFIPVIAILGALLLNPTVYRIAAKAYCLLFAAVAGLNLFALTTGHSVVPDASSTASFTRLSWFLGVYSSMVVAAAIAWLHDYLTHNVTLKTHPEHHRPAPRKEAHVSLLAERRIEGSS